MKADPLNRRFLVEKLAPVLDAEDLGIIIPDDYEESKDPDEHNLYRIITCAYSTEKPLKPGDLVVLEEAMIETVKVNGEEILMIQENYLKARIAL